MSSIAKFVSYIVVAIVFSVFVIGIDYKKDNEKKEINLSWCFTLTNSIFIMVIKAIFTKGIKFVTGWSVTSKKV